MKIGYIGLGLMGKPCTQNLMKAGHTLYIWARNPEKVVELTTQGAILCESPQAVAREVEILFTNVTNTQDVADVLFGTNGVASSKASGLIVVDMSTISATATRQFAEKLAPLQIEFVDAPVSGGTIGAINGTLTFMVGATEATFERIKPILGAMGTTITRIGDTGAGQVAKSCNQIVLTSTLLGIAEAFAFADANGVDPVPVRKALLGGLASSKALEIHGQRMLDDTYVPGFKTVLHHKDMQIIADIAKEIGMDMPCTAIGTQKLYEAIQQGYGEEDSAVIARVIK